MCYNERKDEKGMNEMAKKKESTPGENLAKQIIEQYNPKSVADMQNALKDIFGPLQKAFSFGFVLHFYTFFLLFYIPAIYFM